MKRSIFLIIITHITIAMSINAWTIQDNSIKTSNISINETFSYSSEIHASVGKDYYAQYDTSAFEMQSEIKYHHPEVVNARMCGGDRAKKTMLFTPLKSGTSIIKFFHNFRGEITDSIIYYINVK